MTIFTVNLANHKMKYEIYMKGCYERKTNSASVALVVMRDGKVFNKKSAKFDDIIPTRDKTNIDILPNKGQFQMELYALVWALTLIDITGEDVVAYTNNQVIAGWINKWSVPDDYKRIFGLCDRLAKGGKVYAEWMPKNDGNQWNRLVNDVASELIRMKGSPITKIF